MTGHHKTNFDYTLDRGAKYMPTEEQIAEAAAKIKAENLKALKCKPVAVMRRKSWRMSCRGGVGNRCS